MTYRSLTSERVQVAARLRRMREDRGIERGVAADVLGCTTSKIGDLETGRSSPRPVELEKLLLLYGVAPVVRDELVAFAQEAQKRKPRGTYIEATVPSSTRRGLDLEAQAVSALYYSAEVVPGILQVRSYAEAALTSMQFAPGSRLDTLVNLQMGRRKSLTRVDCPPLQFHCLLGEAALRCGVGGPEVMREQWESLAAINHTLPHVTVQVIPFGSGCHPLFGLTTTVLEFALPAPSIVITAGVKHDSFQDRQSDVAVIAGKFHEVAAKAYSVADTVDFLKHLIRQHAKHRAAAMNTAAGTQWVPYVVGADS
jgi:transcriptional regulator with XRE-family HTH domain